MLRSTLLASLALATSAVADPVLVLPVFGDQILGFAVDPNGTEGVFGDFKLRNNHTTDAAIVTFDQATGAIVKVVKESHGRADDAIVPGVSGDGTALLEWELEKDNSSVARRRYLLMDPIGANAITGVLANDRPHRELIQSFSSAPGSSKGAVFSYGDEGVVRTAGIDLATGVISKAFSVRKFRRFLFPELAYDAENNRAVLASGSGACKPCRKIAFVDLSSGATEYVPLEGKGEANGMALDQEDTVVAVATHDDAAVTFYNYTTGTTVVTTMPGATGSVHSGDTVAYDPVARLFLVVQRNTSTGTSGSSIQIFDPSGSFVKSIDGLLTGIGGMSINPSTRSGYIRVVTDPKSQLQGLERFTY